MAFLTPEIGMRVAHNAKFIKAMGYDKEIADRRGTVIEIDGAEFVKVEWDGEGVLACHVGNLCRVGPDGVCIDPTQ